MSRCLAMRGCFNVTVSSENPPDPYATSSPSAGWLPGVAGPDGIHVTIRVEPAVDRLRRWRHLTSTPEPLTSPISTAFEYEVLPGLVQRYLFRDAWVVDVEADSGDRCRVKAETRDDAMNYARQIRAGVADTGVTFLRTFAR
jgi:hypothetical protein